MQKTILKNLNLSEITAFLQKAGFQGFRGKQIFNWIYVNYAETFEQMKNIPADVRQFLTENAAIGGVESIEQIQEGSDGTRKILFKLHDGNFIESVLMHEKKWWTICVSTQVGCALGCEFCNTGKGGFIRNLETHEIVDQIIACNRHFFADDPETRIRNVVFMGMGEPLLNIDNLLKAIELLTAPNGMELSPKRITVSTSGIADGIKKLGDADVGVNLAISLNAVDNAKRLKIMPITKKYPIGEIINVCKDFPLAKRRKITFEYVLIKDFNDSEKEAEKLVEIIQDLKCKVNIIPFNPHEEASRYQPPTQKAIDIFRNLLDKNDIFNSIRFSKGGDISAACGQLAGHARKKKN